MSVHDAMSNIIVDSIVIKYSDAEKEQCTNITTFDAILSAVHINHLSKYQSEFIIYLAYKLKNLRICIDGKIYDYNSILHIDVKKMNKKTDGYIDYDDGGIGIMKGDSFCDVMSNIECSRFIGITIHY